jgi:hypothetical protein
MSAALLSTVTLLAGVWLTLSPSALGYGDPDIPFGGVWNETVVGITMAVVALIRILTPAASASLSLVNVALGGWLIVAPFALDSGAAMADAVWNDVVVGAIAIAFAAASWVGGRGRLARDT